MKHVQKKNPDARALPLRVVCAIFIAIALIATSAILLADQMITRSFRDSKLANERYISARLAALDLQGGSDDLTNAVIGFVATGERQYMDAYFQEAMVTKRRDHAVEDLLDLVDDPSSSAFLSLSSALDQSNHLMLLEYHAMRLMTDALEMDDLPSEVAAWELTEDEKAMAPEKKISLARNLIFGEDYDSQKTTIRSRVAACTQELIAKADASVNETAQRMNTLLIWQTVLTIFLFVAVVFLVIFISSQVRAPLTNMVSLMRKQQAVPPQGAAELQFVTGTYNEMLEENRKTTARLNYEASHDALTGLYNRAAYDLFRKSTPEEHIALAVVDVDYFKTVNDRYGHNVGDRVLQRVANVLRESFRSADIVCRIGGDEFVVILLRVSSASVPTILRKFEQINEQLADTSSGLPAVSLSIGVAFSDRENPGEDIFKDADKACYVVKEAGRGGVCAYPNIRLGKNEQ